MRLEAPDPLQETSGPLLNLFLFDVNPHPAFRADDPHTLALRLHYLLTSYGKGTKGNGGNQLEAQHVLAHAMSYVHDNAILTRAHVRDAIQAYSAGADSAVRAARDGRPRRGRRACQVDARCRRRPTTCRSCGRP